MIKSLSHFMTAGNTGDTATEAPAGIPLTSRQTLCGDIDMRIDLNGIWHYNGSPIGRKALVKLFASVLRRDSDGQHWLITPAEVCRIKVDDTAFLGVELDICGQNRDQTIRIRTNLDDIVTVDENYPLKVTENPETGAPHPVVNLDNGLQARLTRPVFYELVECGVAGTGKQAHNHGVWSCGRFFVLGNVEL